MRIMAIGYENRQIKDVVEFNFVTTKKGNINAQGSKLISGLLKNCDEVRIEKMKTKTKSFGKLPQYGNPTETASIGHYLKKCKYCGTMIKQCDCKDCTKTIILGVCQYCREILNRS